jgi:hypothetical protein
MKLRTGATKLLFRVGGFVTAYLAFATAFAAPVLVGTPINFTAAQGVAFTGAVATFTSANPANTVVDFTATINWGDGTPPSTGSITAGASSFTVNGTHTYATVGPFTATVTINDANPVATVTVTDSVTVSSAASTLPVPTLNAWALAALAALLGALGLCFVPRRIRGGS